ncbi:MAG TPA: glycoside hydrolase family 2 TIM barrel-domain containing protein, partial [Alphaproteobacteria bacterium]|nr:glycoside hydrolase family 2 TIM barrel-domain containing protein [Alphaproteobacteria bacterium]
EIRVRVTLPDNDPERYGDRAFTEVPHGKQSWYGLTGGIWQSVWLEQRPAPHVAGFRLLPDPAAGRLGGRLLLSHPAPDDAALALRIVGPDGATAAAAEIAIAPGATEAALDLAVPAPRLWSPAEPNLYRVEAVLAVGGAMRDEAAETFGFRTIEARHGRLFLNGEPLYLRGALDQDYYCDTIFTTPSLEVLEDQLRKAKAMGLNLLRCHIKVPDPRYYEVADRLGMLIWTEVPNFHVFRGKAGERHREVLEGILARDGNHPSIIIWTIINEDWGTEVDLSVDDRRWLAEAYRWLKAADPTRLVVDNSACQPNFHVVSDLDDYHYYRVIPDGREEWDQLTEEFANRAHWTYSPHGDAERTGEEPLIVSEFGVWGLPNPKDLLDAEGREPWWFETGFDWADGIMYPHGIEHRFGAFGLDRVFGSLDGFVAETQKQQFLGLKYEIESMRSHATIGGYVITELTDVHWEANGLMDMRRNPRQFASDLPMLNADTIIVPKLSRWAYWSGESVVIDPLVAHGAGPALVDATLEWRCDGRSGRLAVPPAIAGAVVALPRLAVAVETAEPRMLRVEFTLRGRDGVEVNRNYAEVAVFPTRDAAGLPKLWAGDAAMAERAAALGYPLAGSPADADVSIATYFDYTLVEAVRRGVRLVLLAEDEDAVQLRRPLVPVPVDPRYPGVSVKARRGTQLKGDWASTFSWLRRSGPFARLPGGPLLDLSFDRVIPELVLKNFKSFEFGAQVHAALCVGWMHKPSVLIGERPFGQGNAVMTTFRLRRDAPGADPVATTLLDALIAQAAR